MTDNERRAAIEWYKHRQALASMPGAAKMAGFAIEALEHYKTGVVANDATGDTIYRRAAANEINRVLGNYVPYLFGVTETIPLECAAAIKALPPAEQRTGRLYRHYKGGIYEVISYAVHTETTKGLVIYKDSSGHVWARPHEMFYGVLPDGRRRFEPMEDEKMEASE